MKSNVFEQIGFFPEEAAALKIKSELHSQIVKAIKKRGYTQADLAGGPALCFDGVKVLILWVPHSSPILGRVRMLTLFMQNPLRIIISTIGFAHIVGSRTPDCVDQRTLCKTRKERGTLRCKCDRESKSNGALEFNISEMYFVFAL